MNRLILICVLALFILPTFLLANLTYLTDDEYRRLNRREREIYRDNLQTEVTNLQQRKADAIALHEDNLNEIEELKRKIEIIDREYDAIYNRVVHNLNISQDDIDIARRRLDQYREKINNWYTLSDSELWDHARAIRKTINEYEDFKTTNVGKAPDFLNDIAELDRKIESLEHNLDQIRPRYYEDSYTVVRGDYLSKIAGYSFIYDDASKWGIIFRANRDQIRDPNLIYVDQVLKIPRGLPNTWRVYRGESLWRIASYPEVYGNGTEWPLIYRANRDQIKDPDLIYPDQVFSIPRDY